MQTELDAIASGAGSGVKESLANLKKALAAQRERDEATQALAALQRSTSRVSNEHAISRDHLEALVEDLRGQVQHLQVRVSDISHFERIRNLQ